jgi:hypothetical protein
MGKPTRRMGRLPQSLDRFQRELRVSSHESGLYALCKHTTGCSFQASGFANSNVFELVKTAHTPSNFTANSPPLEAGNYASNNEQNNFAQSNAQNFKNKLKKFPASSGVAVAEQLTGCAAAGGAFKILVQTKNNIENPQKRKHHAKDFIHPGV